MFSIIGYRIHTFSNSALKMIMKKTEISDVVQFLLLLFYCSHSLFIHFVVPFVYLYAWFYDTGYNGTGNVSDCYSSQKPITSVNIQV